MNIRSTPVVLALAVLAATACGKKSETVTMKTSDGKVNITTSDAGVPLPAEFPKDVPVMKEAVAKAVMGSAEQGTLVVILSTAKPYAEVVAYYQDGLKAQGWTSVANTNNGEGAIMTFKKGERNMMATIAKDGPNVNIQLALPNNKS